jgi:hypothetical protein
VHQVLSDEYVVGRVIDGLEDDHQRGELYERR